MVLGKNFDKTHSPDALDVAPHGLFFFVIAQDLQNLRAGPDDGHTFPGSHHLFCDVFVLPPNFPPPSGNGGNIIGQHAYVTLLDVKIFFLEG
uniref:Uncharacterized protein n=1 Tax=Lactuca sativa TaxID=4236 RepID=A0A9R1VH35_LACSA|nr:hypothetical protein LSAT_V11C500278120 [Lactuca sativa]